MAESPGISEALRAEITKLVKEGDPEKAGALTAIVLLRIMRVAKTGHELLVSLEASPSNLAALVKRPLPWIGIPPNNEQVEAIPVLDQVAYAPSSPQENFGMIALREIVAMAKNWNGSNSPAKLVEALAIAREKGLTDVADELESQLGMGKPEPATAHEGGKP